MGAGKEQKSWGGGRGTRLQPGPREGDETLGSFSRTAPGAWAPKPPPAALLWLSRLHPEFSLARRPRLFFFFPLPKGVTPPHTPRFPLPAASWLKPITLLCKQSEGWVWGREGAEREGAQGARAAAARLGGRRSGWTGGRPPRRCTSGFVGASVFVRPTNGERTRRWALERRKIHISSTALVSQRPSAHFPRRRSRAPRSAAAACPRPPRHRRRARRAPQLLASSSLGWRWAGAGARVTAVALLPAPRPAPRGCPSLRTGLDG